MDNVEAIAIALGATQQEAVAELMPPPYPGLQDESAVIGRRLGLILARAEPSKRDAIADEIVEFAERMVKIAAA